MNYRILEKQVNDKTVYYAYRKSKLDNWWIIYHNSLCEFETKEQAQEAINAIKKQRKQFKKIDRRLHYYVTIDGNYPSIYFNSARKMRKFVNNKHKTSNKELQIEIEKSWCYREYTPRHRWCIFSERVDDFLKVKY